MIEQAKQVAQRLREQPLASAYLKVGDLVTDLMENQMEAADTIDSLVAEVERLTKVDVEPGFWLSSEYINDFVIDSLKDLIRRAKQCSICDVDLRENGKNVRFEADWIKYMKWRESAPASALAAEQAKVRGLVEVLESVAAMSEEAGISRFARSAIAKYGEQK